MTITSQTTSLLGALSRHNSVSAIRIQDPLEKQLPASGQFAVASPDGPIWFDASSAAFQAAWHQKVARHEQQLADCFHTAGVQAATITTGEDPAGALRLLLGPGGRIG
jgi:hypothetical protein